ncbi:MAG: nucleoside-diphosphate sugar epimerase/dehydratase [Erysipelotrichales bacterium]|nr:nucleoside-diphosphate sugar epimerase/dehydratase [Erysipelotrichales bacterium]
MKSENLRIIILTIIDSIIIAVSYFFSYLLRFEFNIENGIVHLSNLLRAIPIVIVIHIFVFFLMGVMKSLWKYVSIEEAIRLTISIFLSNAIAYFVLNLMGISFIPRSIYIFSIVLICGGIIGIRVAYRYLRLKKRNISISSSSIIIGAGDAGYILAREIKSNPIYETKIVGFIDDNQLKVGRMINGVPILGTTQDLDKILVKYDIECAYIAIPSASHLEIKRILSICQDISLKVKIMGISAIDSLKPTLRDVSIDDLLGRGEIHLEMDKIKGYITNKTIMVTGAGGSIGSELCRQIVKFHPKELVFFDISENSLYDLQQELLMQSKKDTSLQMIKMEFFIGSVRDRKRLQELLNTYRPQVIFHAAAHKHVPLMEDAPKEAIKNNVFGTLNVVECSIEAKVQKLILISTDKAVNPTNVMGATKRMCELIIQSYKDNGITNLAAVRFGNVLGSNGSVIPLFKKQIKQGGPITVTDRNITRYFMTIPEATQLVLQAGAYANKGDIFVLDMGEPVKIFKLAEDLIRLSGLKPYEDIKIECVGLRPGEKMYEELALGDEIRHKTENNLIYVNEPMDISKVEVLKKIEKLQSVITDDLNDNIVKELILKIIHD